MQNPILVEPGVKYFLKETLKQCHQYKESHNYILLNVALLSAFVFILILILIIKFKGKLTPKEIEIKENENKQYILSKIKNYQDTKLIESQSLITGLPKWN
jgi:hypothetical protein